MNSFTVVICTYRRSFLIKKCLEHILNNTLLPSKIIIIDQNYDYSTYKKIINIFKIKKFDNYEIIRNLTQKGLTKSKNISLKYVKTKYVFFIDDDITLNNNFFIENIILISKKKAHGVSGVISNYDGNFIRDIIYYCFNFNIFKDNRFYFKNFKKLKKKNSYAKVFQLPGGITCFNKKVFKKCLFDEKLVKHNYEDVEFNINLRKKFKKVKLYINFNAEAFDNLKKKSKENIFNRFYYLRLIYLKNKNYKILIFYYLSLLGLIFSNITNLYIKDYIKMYKYIKKADKKLINYS